MPLMQESFSKLQLKPAIGDCLTDNIDKSAMAILIKLVTDHFIAHCITLIWYSKVCNGLKFLSCITNVQYLHAQ